MFANRLIKTVAIGLTCFHLYTGAFGPFVNIIQRSIHVGLGLVLCFAIYALDGKKNKGNIPWYDWLMLLFSAFACGYIIFHYDRIVDVDFFRTDMDIIIGLILALVSLEAARRAIGLVFPLLAMASMLYAYFGPYLPGIFRHRGLSLGTMGEILFLSDRGMFGPITGISATVIAMFVIFGALLLRTGGGQAFMDFAIWAGGRAYGGPAKVATIASSLFGSVSGSAGANVATTGAFTIPLMKRLGFKPEFAAGVEATASTGGQIMPPIMGAGAFIMAELLGRPYLEIALAGLGPALLFYVGVYLAIHFESKRAGYTRVPPEDIPKAASFLRWSTGGPVFVPLLVLIFFLVRGFTPTTCGFYAIVAAICLFLISAPAKLAKNLKTLFEGFEEAGRGLVVVVVLIVCAQVILAMVSTTGLGVKFSGLMMELGRTNIWLALILAMAISIILGMGLPTSAAYILAAAVVAPALIKLGLEPITAHFFIFYYAIASGLTPPVCAVVFVAASMAQASWVKTAWVSLRLGLVAFIAPFMFVKDQSLLLQGDPWEIPFALGTAAIGVISLAGATMGYALRRVQWHDRLLLLGGGILMLVPGVIISLTGLALFVAALFIQRLRPAEPVPSGLSLERVE